MKVSRSHLAAVGLVEGWKFNDTQVTRAQILQSHFTFMTERARHDMKIRATVICEEARQVLLVRKPNSRWMLPGGTVERGETHVDAAIRELAEETGLNAENLLYLMQMNDGTTEHHVYEASAANLAEARPQNEISDCLWHPLDAIAQLQLKKGTREILEAFRRRL